MRVVVVEAGPPDKDKFIHIPAAFSKLFCSAVDWNYLTDPQKELEGRQIYWPRGKTLGGSSSINAMMWVRGFAADYDEWGELAGRGLVLRVRGEVLQAGSRTARWWCRSSAARAVPPPTWLAAVEAQGHRVEAPNQASPEGFCETLVTQRRGARWSTADAYLKPALRRQNLKLLTEATVTRVLFDGRRAVGVEVRHRRQTRGGQGATRVAAVCAARSTRRSC